MYTSHFASTSWLDAYLRDGRITGPSETARAMIGRVVTALATADRHFDPGDAGAFAQQLGAALDDRRIVFSTPRHDQRRAARHTPACRLRGTPR
jgi:hypothetical protein